MRKRMIKRTIVSTSITVDQIRRGNQATETEVYFLPGDYTKMPEDKVLKMLNKNSGERDIIVVNVVEAVKVCNTYTCTEDAFLSIAEKICEPF